MSYNPLRVLLRVLILVLVEDGLGAPVVSEVTDKSTGVLILVLVEDGLGGIEEDDFPF